MKTKTAKIAVIGFAVIGAIAVAATAAMTLLWIALAGVQF